MSKTFARRTILVTGASSGIGRAVRDRLLAEDHSVIALSRTPTPESKLSNSGGGRYHPVACDLSVLDDIPAAMDQICREFPDLDGVVSNAGAPAFGGLEQWAPEKIKRMIDLNLTSHLLVVRGVIARLKRRELADVILMGSESALQGGKQGSIYCAAKFGLRGFADSLRREASSSGVRVSIVHPGMVRTPFFEGLDFGPGEDSTQAIEPEDVADAVALVLHARVGTVFDEIVLSPQKKVVVKKVGVKDVKKSKNAE